MPCIKSETFINTSYSELMFVFSQIDGVQDCQLCCESTSLLGVQLSGVLKGFLRLSCNKCRRCLNGSLVRSALVVNLMMCRPGYLTRSSLLFWRQSLELRVGLYNKLLLIWYSLRELSDQHLRSIVRSLVRGRCRFQSLQLTPISPLLSTAVLGCVLRQTTTACTVLVTSLGHVILVSSEEVHCISSLTRSHLWIPSSPDHIFRSPSHLVVSVSG